MLKSPSSSPGRRTRYPGKRHGQSGPGGARAALDRRALDEGAPPGPHRPIMLAEVLRCLRPRPGDIAVDCTLGGGGHARAVLERVQPGGRLIGLDVDSLELPQTEARLRAAGFGPATLVARQANFRDLPHVLAAEGVTGADLVLADLGVSSMQRDDPSRGFSYKAAGPLDLRMDPTRGEPASALIDRLDQTTLADLLHDHADEPHAAVIARVLKRRSIATTDALGRLVRAAVAAAAPGAPKAEVKMSVRRTLQALRIAVNDEFAALDSLLAALPGCLANGGRVAILTFHSGEDRRVKQAFRSGRRAGVYAAVADRVIRSTVEETRANRRASSAKLRWAVRR